MSPEKEKVIVKILLKLLGDDTWDGTLKGSWPNRRCLHCHGTDGGYGSSQSFDHSEDCPTLLISELKKDIEL